MQSLYWLKNCSAVRGCVRLLAKAVLLNSFMMFFQVADSRHKFPSESTTTRSLCSAVSNGSALTYLACERRCLAYIPSCSRNRSGFYIPRVRHGTIGDCALPIATPCVWNCLPPFSSPPFFYIIAWRNFSSVSFQLGTYNFATDLQLTVCYCITLKQGRIQKCFLGVATADGGRGGVVVTYFSEAHRPTVLLVLRPRRPSLLWILRPTDLVYFFK